MRIGFLSTRLAGTDGVSLEVEKWAGILEKLGHEIFYCAGELGGYAGGGTLIPLLHFHHPVIAAINKRAFDPVESKDRQILLSDIHAVESRRRVFLHSKHVRRPHLLRMLAPNAAHGYHS